MTKKLGVHCKFFTKKILLGAKTKFGTPPEVAAKQISIFRCDPCQKFKGEGQISGKPKGGPLEEKYIFFTKK